MHKSGDTWHFSDGSTLTEAQADAMADCLESDEVFEKFVEVPTSGTPVTPSARV